MSEGDRPVYCEQCGSLAEAGDKFCGVCGAGITPNAPDATTREIPSQVQPPQGGTEDQVTPTRNNRAFLVAGVVGAVFLLLVGGGALAFAGLGSVTGLLGGTDPKPVSPANTRETTTSPPSEPTSSETIAEPDGETGIQLGQASTGPMFEQETYQLKNQPDSITTADLDGDGDMDLATANAYTNNVSVLLNNDDGSFSSAGSYQVGYGPYSITASDLDGDGDADLATANNDSNNVSVLLNNDDGTFADAGNYEAGIGAFSITASDLDGDSDADLAAANASSNDISVLVNNGDGTFDGDVNYPVGDQPYSITATDLDGDGDVDLANANRASDNVSVLVNNDDATFADAVNYPVEGGPDSITASDLDSDDDMDLATVNGDSSTISVLFNNGEGTFDGDESYAVEDQLHSVTAADLNGDDDADLATAGVFSNNVSLLVNNGGGTFSDTVDYPVGDWPNSITNADLDGDGDMDLATANSGSSNVSVLLNKGEGNQGSSEGNNGEPGTGEDTSSPNDSEEASLDQTVEGYYLAAGAEEWDYTYDHLDSQTQSMFTEEEWSRKNQWFWDRNPVVYHILSIESDGESEGSVAEVELRITGEDGSSWTRTTYFVQEDGEWLHRFSEEETDLFMPDATFEEFVEAQTDASP